MASTSRDNSVYVKVTDAKTNRSKNITIKGIPCDDVLDFITKKVASWRPQKRVSTKSVSKKVTPHA